jgi:hypothetical protein
MINNPFVNRLAVIVLMFAVYAAGVSGGREQTVLTLKARQSVSRHSSHEPAQFLFPHS